EFLDLRFFPSLFFFLWDSFWRLRPAWCSIISSTVATGQARNLVVLRDWQIIA
ncbi:hypothetical protein NDU88_006023, partial [Pleurodeles waltl]